MTETPIISVKNRRKQSENEKFTFDPSYVRIGESEYINNYRRSALQSNIAFSIPTTKEEAWRRTDLSHLHPEKFLLISSPQKQNSDGLKIPILPKLTGVEPDGYLIIGTGGIETSISTKLMESGVIFTDLLNAEKNYPEIIEKVMGKVIHAGEGKFASLAGAFSQHGILLYIPPGVKIEEPLHSVLAGSGKDQALLSHILVYLDEGSSATYIHESISTGGGYEGTLFHNGIVEIIVGDNANLQFVELQSWGENVWNITHEACNIDQGGKLDWIFGAVGSHLTKNFTDINLVGEGSSGKMSGFVFSNNDQHFDHDTQQNHFARHTTSDLLFKGALLDNSYSVWQGMIYVAPGASGADGYQANRNLTLSPNARADSIPGLEILNDDVRCTHGATVGKIDEEQIFYLLSRGISRSDAERLIVEGFFEPIMERIPIEGIRNRFHSAIQAKMQHFRRIA